MSSDKSGSFVSGAASALPADFYQSVPSKPQAASGDEKLYSLAVEHGPRRLPGLYHFHAKSPEDARAHLVRLVSNRAFPKRSHIVAQGMAIGVLGDESGKSIVV